MRPINRASASRRGNRRICIPLAQAAASSGNKGGDVLHAETARNLSQETNVPDRRRFRERVMNESRGAVSIGGKNLPVHTRHIID